MKHFFVLCMSVVITSYFVYHGIYGHRGILRLYQLRQEYAQAIQKNTILQEKVSQLRLKVGAISGNSPSVDLIEEELMRVLNMGHADDVILLDNNEKFY